MTMPATDSEFIPRFMGVGNVPVSDDVNDSAALQCEILLRVKALRRDRGWSQKYVAEKLGLRQSGYARFERGRTQITISRLDQLTTILNLNHITQLVFGIDLSQDSWDKRRYIARQKALVHSFWPL